MVASLRMKNNNGNDSEKRKCSLQFFVFSLKSSDETKNYIFRFSVLFRFFRCSSFYILHFIILHSSFYIHPLAELNQCVLNPAYGFVVNVIDVL